MRKEKSLVLMFFGSVGLLFYLNFLSVNSITFLLKLLIFGVGAILLHWGYSKIDEKNSPKLKWFFAFIETFIALICLAIKSQMSPIIAFSIGIFLTLILVLSIGKYILKKEQTN